MKQKKILHYLVIVCLLLITKTSIAQDDAVKDTAVIDTTYNNDYPPPAIDEAVRENDDEDRIKFELRSAADPQHPVERRMPPGEVERLKSQDAFWYADTTPEKPKQAETSSSTYIPVLERTWFQTLLWLMIIGVFATALVIYFSEMQVGMFRKRTARQSDTTNVDDELPEDIFAINYQKEIDKAVSAGNFRLGVRLMYLRLLKQMTERNMIRYSQEKTNFDYLLQIHPTAYYKDFFRITRNYEFSWYGKFDVSESAFHVIRDDFSKFEKSFH